MQRSNAINVIYVYIHGTNKGILVTVTWSTSDLLPKGWNTELRCPGSFWSCSSLRENTEAAATQMGNKKSVTAPLC